MTDDTTTPEPPPAVPAVLIPVTLATVAQVVAVYPDTRPWYEGHMATIMSTYGGVGIDDYWLLTVDEWNRLAVAVGIDLGGVV